MNIKVRVDTSEGSAFTMLKTGGISAFSVLASILIHAAVVALRRADDAGAKAGEFFTPPEVVDTLVRILEPRPWRTQQYAVCVDST